MISNVKKNIRHIVSLFCCISYSSWMRKKKENEVFVPTSKIENNKTEASKEHNIESSETYNSTEPNGTSGNQNLPTTYTSTNTTKSSIIQIASTKPPATEKPTATIKPTTVKPDNDPYSNPYDRAKIISDMRAYAESKGMVWNDGLTKSNQWGMPIQAYKYPKANGETLKDGCFWLINDTVEERIGGNCKGVGFKILIEDNPYRTPKLSGDIAIFFVHE